MELLNCVIMNNEINRIMDNEKIMASNYHNISWREVCDNSVNYRIIVPKTWSQKVSVQC